MDFAFALLTFVCLSDTLVLTPVCLIVSDFASFQINTQNECDQSAMSALRSRTPVSSVSSTSRDRLRCFLLTKDKMALLFKR